MVSDQMHLARWSEMKRVSETRTRPRDGAAAGNKGKRKKARTRRRRGRNPVGQGYPPSAIIEGQPRGGRYGPGVPLLNVGCERASEPRAGRSFEPPSSLSPPLSLHPSLPLKSIYLPTYSRQLDRSARRQNRAS